jgi:hypothetical protein
MTGVPWKADLIMHHRTVFQAPEGPLTRVSTQPEGFPFIEQHWLKQRDMEVAFRCSPVLVWLVEQEPWGRLLPPPVTPLPCKRKRRGGL